ncbi:hypothetical protein EB795_28840 [Pseudomonas mandelii]|nr:hypothetical protein [Pseudomonas mandelii]
MTTHRNTELGIEPVVMLGELAVNRMLDNLDPKSSLVSHTVSSFFASRPAPTLGLGRSRRCMEQETAYPGRFFSPTVCLKPPPTC